MQQPEQISGIVDRIIYHNNENGFAIFVVHSKIAKEIFVKATVAAINAGEQITMTGSWTMHPKFGKQFEASECSTTVPTSVMGLKKYLASGMIKGIGPAYAEKLVAAFGTEVLDVIDTQPYRLHQVPGIGPKRVERIIIAWQDQKEISHIMVFLQDKGISPAYATKIYKRYGKQSINVLQENPYRLADDIWGIGFKIADQIAKNMGMAHDSLKRINSGILYTLSTFVGFGNLYANLDELREKTVALLELEPSEENLHKVKLALHDLYNSDKIKLISYQDIHYVATSLHYHSEKGVATRITELLQYPLKRTFDINAIYEKLRTANDAIALNEDQQRGILTALQNKISVITGGPGTGKTTLIKKMLSILDEHHVVYKLAAPTGRAAKRITEGTGKPAVTLHRLLDFNINTMGFAHNEQNALALDFLIIDEASMIDIFLAHAIFKAVPFNAQIIFIGDVDQLPSVGAGNFLNDLINSLKAPTIRLTQIFRQAQDSMIILNAHLINHGEFPTTAHENARNDFMFIKEENPENVTQHLQKIYKLVLPKYGITYDESIVLVPMNRGVVGTIKINHDLQQILNHQSTDKYLTHAGTTFKLGDRVMQIRNNYDKLVFNGDIGFIQTIDTIEKTMLVNFLGQMVTYEHSELDELVLAYAISIHKSQGSEFNAVIIPIFMQHFMLLQRNLVYTAITRAKKLCIFIGQPKAIAMAIKNNKGLVRTTFLNQYLTSDLKCR